MYAKTHLDAPLQPLPNHVQERVWEFVRRQIQDHEHATGGRVAKFEIHVSDGGHIRAKILGTQEEKTATIEAGLEG